MDTALVRASILSLTPGQITPEQAAETYARLMVLADQVKELRKLYESAIIEHINATGQNLPAGDGENEWRVSRTRKVTARSNAAVADAVLTLAGGDVGTLVECLAAQPWRHGQIRSRLEQSGRADDFARLFSEEWTEKTELKRVNTRFIKGRADGDDHRSVEPE